MQRWIATALVLCACGGDDEAGPPPIGSGTASSTLGTVTIGMTSDGTGTSGSSTSSDASTTDASSGAMSGTGPPVETGSETPCGDWAEVYIGCIGSPDPIAEVEAGCEMELAGWEEPLPNCRVLAEELLICVTQLPCQPFSDWERNAAVPVECAPQVEALEQNCSFVGTTTA